jgi:hypothetical protein
MVKNPAIGRPVARPVPVIPGVLIALALRRRRSS